ncbi:MAG TPA: hypothetical protein PLK94_09480 [Alphaproteobacteria bacterium]|nr:hypothetical protein [Alphaproteobacteria bacterium]HOO51501.1 hypothetical protein [Alphaproteobacteria bacterium]
MNKILAVALAFVVVGVSAPVAPAFAEEKLMELWTNQRAIHSMEMKLSEQKYKRRGQAYVDQLYASHGEVPLGDDTDMHNDLDLLPVVNPKPVNVSDVAQIIRENTMPQAPVVPVPSR